MRIIGPQSKPAKPVACQHAQLFMTVCIDGKKVTQQKRLGIMAMAGGSEEYVVCVGCGDIDLIVVTDDDYMPRNYKENMQNYLKVSSVLRETRKKIPIDLIVHTRPMHEKFIQLGSMFSRDVTKRGVVLYEKDI